jgi:hypothetical protein
MRLAKYGVSWQIVPEPLIDMIADGDRNKAGRAMEAMMRMTKIDIGALRDAHGRRRQVLWPTLTAIGCLVGAQAVFWTFTFPAN